MFLLLNFSTVYPFCNDTSYDIPSKTVMFSVILRIINKKWT